MHHHSCVYKVPIFKDLNEKQVATIEAIMHPIILKKDEMVYHAGEESNTLYIINSGQVKLYKLSESGKEIVLDILSEGDFTGELSLFNDLKHDSYAQALNKVSICSIRRDLFQELLINEPAISLEVLKEFSARLKKSQEHTARVSIESVESRLAKYLLDFMPETSITLPMSKRDLASHIGTTPETLSRKLNQFEELNLISQSGQRSISLIDPDGLSEII